TVTGAALMGLADSVGCIREGYLADLLLVKGDPTKDVSLLQKKENLSLIMKNGVIHKNSCTVVSSEHYRESERIA
ncbi:MAG: amidohydrolase family protein, partial [Granulosicoccus sp.]|nr:amidohydrolase family protein [Granulosicoccus sp.]